MKKGMFTTCRWTPLGSEDMCLEPTVNGRECAGHAPRLIWPQDDVTIEAGELLADAIRKDQKE